MRLELRDALQRALRLPSPSVERDSKADAAGEQCLPPHPLDDFCGYAAPAASTVSGFGVIVVSVSSLSVAL